MEYIEEILEYLDSDDPIPKKTILRWMASDDLVCLGEVYALTRDEWERIQPELTVREQCSFMAKYLLGCIETDPESTGSLFSGFGAAWELTSWLKHLISRDGTDSVIRDVVDLLTELYKRSDAKTRNRIETGAVEHIFENAGLRRYFNHWKNDPELLEAYRLCMGWGRAHEDSSG